MSNSDIKDWLNLVSPRYLLPIAAATGFLIFAPAPVITNVGLTAFKKAYEAWIGGGFLLSSVLLVSQSFFGVIAGIRRIRARRAWHSKAVERLHQLSPEEQYVLQPYLLERIVTRNLDFTNGTVATLEHERIITKAADIGNILDGWPYRIQDWALNYLMLHPELLGLGTRELPPDGRQ